MIKNLIAAGVLATAFSLYSMNEKKNVINTTKANFTILVQQQNLEAIEGFIQQKGTEARNYISLEAFLHARAHKQSLKQKKADIKIQEQSCKIYEILKKNTSYVVTQRCRPLPVRLEERTPTPELMQALGFTAQETELVNQLRRRLSDGLLKKTE